jgi:hypothetical protein
LRQGRREQLDLLELVEDRVEQEEATPASMICVSRSTALVWLSPHTDTSAASAGRP